MDNQTKALLAKGLLHTSGLVVAHEDVGYGKTVITAFPPQSSLIFSDHWAYSVMNEDPEHAIAYIAKTIGHQVQKAVEQQILKAWKMSAQDAMSKVLEAKQTFLANTPWMPYDKKQDTIWSLPHMDQHLEPVKPYHWSDPQVDVLQDIKDTMAKYQSDAVVSGKSLYETLFFGETVSHVDFATNQNFNAPLAKKNPAPAKAMVSEWTKPLHDAIPGFAEMKRACPACKDFDIYDDSDPFLQDTIIHLNDEHKWTREAIADWLETLDYDLTFKTPEEVK